VRFRRSPHSQHIAIVPVENRRRKANRDSAQRKAGLISVVHIHVMDIEKHLMNVNAIEEIIGVATIPKAAGMRPIAAKIRPRAHWKKRI
jgi:hypothetical protein